MAKFWRTNGSEYSPKSIIPKVKFRGRSITIGVALVPWGGNIEIVKARMNGEYYKNILQRNARQIVHLVVLKIGWVFKEDKDPKCNATLTKSCLGSNRIGVLEWLSPSADFSPFEDLWWELKMRIQRRNSEKPAWPKVILSRRMENY